MMQGPSFFEYLSSRMIAIAASKNEQHVIGPDGKLQKGRWVTMRGTHIFLLNDKIEAGPPDFIGKRVDDLSDHDWEQMRQNRKTQNPLPGPHREAVTKKYMAESARISRIKNKSQRIEASEKLWDTMAAEDDFHLIFLNTDGTPSETLDELAKAFSDYGAFPASGTYQEKVTFYKDRIALLHELSSALPKDAKADAAVHIAHISEQLADMEKRTPLHERQPQPKPAPEPAVHVHKAPKHSPQPQQQQQHQQSPQPQQSAPSNTPQSSSTPTQRMPKQVTRTVVPGGTPLKQQPTKNVIPKQQPVYNLKHPNPAHDRAWAQVMYLTYSAMRFVFGALCQFVASSPTMKKSTAYEIKRLHSFTKQQLSRINVNERDSIFDVFLKSFGIA